jgi:hypothetical protein
MDGLLDASWAIAEETSWIMPPHLNWGSGQHLPDVEHPIIDLRVAGLGKQMAEALYLLGGEMDEISPHWRTRINYELRRQVLEPYLNDSFNWETTHSNWNAVCTDGVVASALLGDFDTATRARVIEKAVRSVPYFLKGFTADGGCTEGPGYWVYGVRNYCSLAYYLHCATGGAIDLLADPLMRRVLDYPPAMVLSGRNVVAFADCPRQVGFRSGAIAWCAERLALPDMVALAATGAGRRPYVSTMLDICLLPEPRGFRPRQRTVLADLQVVTARGDGEPDEQLVLAVKGGHNAEIHNHNDVGAFIVHWRGVTPICDLGAGNYIKQLFDSGRYELFSTRSLGHNVPYVNGREQPAGAEFRASGFTPLDEPGLTGARMELAAAYPAEAGIASLQRTVALHAGEEQFVELRDQVEFSGEECAYELPLYTDGTFGQPQDGAIAVECEGRVMRVTYDPAVVEARVDAIEHGDVRWEREYGPTLSRCTLVLKGEPQRATVKVKFVPVR